MASIAHHPRTDEEARASAAARSGPSTMSTMRVDESKASDGPVVRLVEELRNSGAWFKLAADRLEAGALDDALNMTKVGLFGVNHVPAELERLQRRGRA